MNLIYAVERLLDSGWTPDYAADLDHLPDGRPFPSVAEVQREFARAGLDLRIKQNFMFDCHRATWAPTGERIDDATPADDRHGTVIGTCPREAAVYALAQHRTYGSGRPLVGVSAHDASLALT